MKTLAGYALGCLASGLIFVSGRAGNSFINFETAPIHPLALTPDGTTLAVCNLPDGRVELFDVSDGIPIRYGDVPVGIDPVSCRFRTANELWVANFISSSVNIIDINRKHVIATLPTGTGPADIVFAGTPARAFVSCARSNIVMVFDPVTRVCLTNIAIDGDRPKAMAISPDGSHVYVAIFESGNASTLLTGVASASVENPPPGVPNRLIVKKTPLGRWMDDTNGDWTEFISGTNAAFSGRPTGWNMPDHDVAIIDSTNYDITYASGLMNICMDLAVHPSSRQITVVGTDGTNERRFEPNLRGTFIHATLAWVHPATLAKTALDLNPHLDYSTSSVPQAIRDQSIGDPRGIIWNATGTRGYVTGMGSRNLVVIDGNGRRVSIQPVELAEGPCGLVLDEVRRRLYVLNRFSASISVLDTATLTVLTNIGFFDPTPAIIKAGRRHLYDTRVNSGLGQASCGSCHVDARFDRLAWDLGNPAGAVTYFPVQLLEFTPMKGPLMTQTLQDIIGLEPLHWRGDRNDIESFNITFTDLLARDAPLATNEMQEFKDFLATIHFPPNPFRNFDNSLPTNMPLPGFYGVNCEGVPDRTPLSNGNALSAQIRFFSDGNSCSACHGLRGGRDNDFGRDHPLHRREDELFKVAQLRSLPDKLGMDRLGTSSRAGFGFRFDGRADTLTRFLVDVFQMRTNQDIADLTAFMLAFSGSAGPGDVSREAAAAIGQQVTLTASGTNAMLAAMLALAHDPSSRTELVARGMKEGLNRGWFYNRDTGRFQSDRDGEDLWVEELIAFATPDAPLTYTVVAPGTGLRVGIDRDSDGRYDRSELDHGSDPNDPCSLDAHVPPALVSLADAQAHAGALVWRSVAGAYNAEPCQRMRFELLPGFPDGASLDATTGLFTWTIPVQATGTHTVPFRIEFNRTPPDVATNSFRVTIVPLQVKVRRHGSGAMILEWQEISALIYRVQYKDRLEDAFWRNLEGSFNAGGLAWDESAKAAPQRFYRLTVAD